MKTVGIIVTDVGGEKTHVDERVSTLEEYRKIYENRCNKEVTRAPGIAIGCIAVFYPFGADQGEAGFAMQIDSQGSQKYIVHFIKNGMLYTISGYDDNREVINQIAKTFRFTNP